MMIRKVFRILLTGGEKRWLHSNSNSCFFSKREYLKNEAKGNTIIRTKGEQKWGLR